MVFSSFTFIFLFLPVFLAIYYLAVFLERFLPPWANLKNLIALLASCLFYTWGAPQIIILLLCSSCLDVFFTRFFDGPKRRLAFAAGILVNVSLLCYFKYSNFFIEQVNSIFTALGQTPVTWVNVALPAGISFFTFHKISYLADIYTHRTKPVRHVVDYLLYVTFFPQLIAGPILRFHDVCDQIIERKHSAQMFFEGFFRFSIGLAKKVLIADAVGKVASQIFGIIGEGQTLPGMYVWVGLLAYTLQIYFDFSAYSDMAIGLARMCGFRFLENFNLPYISQTITEFWRRWHISLSNWMREYLYIPIGGSRGTTFQTYRNLVLVFFISGLWHGANWTFIFWGLYHGFFLVIDRVFWKRIADRIWKPVNILLTFFLVMIGWVFFRSPTIHVAFDFLGLLLPAQGFFEAPTQFYRAALIDNRETCMFVLALIISFIPASDYLRDLGKRLWNSLPAPAQILTQGLVTLTLFLLSVVTISSAHFSPFLYFEF